MIARAIFFLGWAISHNNPGAMSWRATKFGVEICAESYETILSMIRTREGIGLS